MLRYDDIGKEYSEKDIERQKLVVHNIYELLLKVNPTKEIIGNNRHIVDKLIMLLIDIFSNDLKFCTEREFFP